MKSKVFSKIVEKTRTLKYPMNKCITEILSQIILQKN